MQEGFQLLASEIGKWATSLMSRGSCSATVKGATLEMTYSEALDETSTPDPSDFTVMVEGAARGVDRVAVSGPSRVTLTLSSAVMFDEAVTVSYRPGTYRTPGEGCGKVLRPPPSQRRR